MVNVLARGNINCIINSNGRSSKHNCNSSNNVDDDHKNNNNE